jgi:Ni,Fe-hydrogenase III large subunit
VDGGLFGDADAGRAAGELDELVGAAEFLAGAVDDAKAGGSRSCVFLGDFETAVEDALPVALDDDAEIVAVLVEKERIHASDLL